MCCDYFISLNGIYNNPTLFILQHFLLRIETFRQKLGTINFEKIIKLLKNQEEKIDDVLNFLKSSIILPVKLDDLRKLFGGYSKYQQETILRDIENTCKKFVPTSITAKCIKHLEDKNLLILVGNPGVGKSYNQFLSTLLPKI